MGELAPEQQPPEAEAPAEEEAPWTGPSQEDWTATQEALQALTPLAQQWAQWQETPPEQEAAAGELDPFSDGFLQQLDAYLDQKLAPVVGYTQEQQYGEAEERAMDIINDVAQREGEFLFPEQSPRLARARANDLIFEMQQKFGRGPKAAEAALERAVKEVRDWEQAVGKAYHDRQVNQLQNLGQARREPGAAGTQAADQLVTPEGGDEMALVRSFFPAAR